MAQDNFFYDLFRFKFTWLKNLFHKADKGLLSAAINVTNYVKLALQSGVVDLITGIIPGDIDDKIVAFLKEKVPIILADELLLQQVGAPTTEADAKDLAVKLIDSFGKFTNEDKEQLYTSVAAKVYIFLETHSNGEKVTFGQAAALVEDFYQEWLNKKK